MYVIKKYMKHDIKRYKIYEILNIDRQYVI